MVQINYDAENFGAHWGVELSGSHQLTCTWQEIVWSAITVGKRHWGDVWKSGKYSQLEAIFRATMVYAYLMENNSSQRLVQSDAFKRLDPSEKGAISYFYGLMSSKLLAEKLLNVPWLMHLDVYKDQLAISSSGNSKPDLVGLNNNGEWVVVEAKGRSNSFDRKALDKAKTQTGFIKQISGKTPILFAAVQSYFSNGNFRTRIADPDDVNENAVDLKLTLQDYIKSYYKLLFDLIENEKSQIVELYQNKYIIVDIEQADLKVGINKDLYTFLNKKEFGFDSLLGIFLMTEIKGFTDNENYAYLGKDGIVVVCGNSWSIENMQKNPGDRKG